MVCNFPLLQGRPLQNVNIIRDDSLIHSLKIAYGWEGDFYGKNYCNQFENIQFDNNLLIEFVILQFAFEEKD